MPITILCEFFALSMRILLKLREITCAPMAVYDIFMIYACTRSRNVIMWTMPRQKRVQNRLT